MKNNIIILTIIGILILGVAALIKWGSFGEKDTMEPTTASLTQYQNETPHFSFSHPESMLVSENDGNALVSVSALSPDDPRRASDIGLMSTLNVRQFEGDSVEAYIQKIAQDQFTEQFIFSDITLDNGVSVPSIIYTNAFGARVQESFIEVDSNNILVLHFVADTDYSADFEKILRSFAW